MILKDEYKHIKNKIEKAAKEGKRVLLWLSMKEKILMKILKVVLKK